MNQEEFYRALSRLSDRDISPELFKELEEHLLSSEQAREEYREFIHLQTLIGLEVSIERTPQEVLQVVSVEKKIYTERLRTYRALALSAAALLLLGLTLMGLFSLSTEETALVFEASPSSQFEVTHIHKRKGAVMDKGSRLKLSAGNVELKFKSGVKSIVSAPADLLLHDETKLIVHEGTAWFQVPKGAEGFTVESKNLNIVDLGTEFGVISKEGEDEEVHVFNGMVEARTLPLKEKPLIIVGGEARRIDSTGRLLTLPPNREAFLRELPRGEAADTLPVKFTDGTHGGDDEHYTVDCSGSVIGYGTGGDVVIDSGGRVKITFPHPIDVQISAGRSSFNKSEIWNSHEDFGTLTLRSQVAPQLEDPNTEILFKRSSPDSFSWKFLRPNSDRFRDPALQSWSINLHQVRELSLSKDAQSKGRSTFNLQVSRSEK